MSLSFPAFAIHRSSASRPMRFFGSSRSTKTEPIRQQSHSIVPMLRRAKSTGLFLLGKLRAGCNPGGGRHMEIAQLHPICRKHGPVGVAYIIGPQDGAAARIDGNELLAAAGR